MPDSTVHQIRAGRPSRIRRPGRMLGAALAAMLAVGLAACSSDPLADKYTELEGNGYVAADGFTVVDIPEADRGEPVVFGGVTEDGEEFSSADIAGDVTVVNFWYSSCGPCRVEAADLEATWQQFQDEDVSFIGVNIYDQPDTAKAFAKQFGITYPSLIDVDSGEAKLAFAQAMPIQAPPTTVVLDTQGRVSARIIGPIDSTSILATLVREALAESA